MNANPMRPAIGLLLLMTILCGLVYPLAVTGIAGLLFPAQAAGSLVYAGGKPIGSRLIGQNFAAPKYFWGRPSATTPRPYDATASTGSNLGPLNPALIERIRDSARSLQQADPGNREPIPVDLVTSSASGLDPDISLAAALYQVPRVARARGLPAEEVRQLVRAHGRGRALGFLGEPRVNVLELNLALDGQH
ncbi:MAG TPA: potassium-transporting ATPase subunit KdpC [Steroidobacteraceae bacterium]|nr:potassium-transporting ATPase subunit KdpC [Steroidobacteraceae bacterium]